MLYMGDLFVTGSNKLQITMLLFKLMQKFTMTNLGLITKYLGVQFTNISTNILLHQTNFTLSILCEFSFMDNKPTFIPLNEGLRFLNEQTLQLWMLLTIDDSLEN